jgi:hypothetical protein
VPPVRELARCLLGRTIYKRLAAIVASGPRGASVDPIPSEWFDRLQEVWVKANPAAREKQRTAIQDLLVADIRRRRPDLTQEYDQLPDEVKSIAVLFDVPWKRGEHGALPVVMEGRSQTLFGSIVWKTLAEGLNRSASIPRVFVHPAAAPVLRALPEATVRQRVIEVLDLTGQAALFPGT